MALVTCLDGLTAARIPRSKAKPCLAEVDQARAGGASRSIDADAPLPASLLAIGVRGPVRRTQGQDRP
ncbi:MAG: hypothetical protein DCF30_16055 [Hyphomicrobiales bacterium]|nr:MAG: hypothetical protein DCF30_16055 [Hyphomicrobiales bacterium]